MLEDEGKRVILKIRNLTVKYRVGERIVHALENIDLDVYEGEILGIVGESGSGKSTLGHAIGRLLPPNAQIVSGSIEFMGKDIMSMDEAELSRIRGKDLAYVFQDPHNSLNPVIKVGPQVGEVLLYHYGIKDKKTLFERVVEAFRRVRIQDSERRYYSYPHELSGGMKQRAVLSSSIISGAKLIIADEPTSALDVTIQRQLINVFSSLREMTHTSIIIITHDVGVVAQLADRIAVMYAGRIVEIGDCRSVLKEPMHPYTRGLISSIPDIHTGLPRKRLTGFPPDMSNPPSGCRFHPRCPMKIEECEINDPGLEWRDGRLVRCIRV